MKHTAFTEIHEKLGAKMQEFAGYKMPIEYSGVKDEHITVRTNAGVFDVSHMGEFWVKGKNAAKFVQWVTSNDITKLTDGKAQYSCFPNGKGGIVDDLLVYRFNEKKYLLVVNAANIEKDWDWCNKQNKFDAELVNASDDIAQLAVQGPNATEILQKLTDINLSEVKFYTFTAGEIAGVNDVIISATGYTGAGGFELYMKPEDGEKIWHAIFEAGKEQGIKPIGLAARDTLRLEMGYCLYGNDIDETTSPIEAGLGWITKFNDENDFIDKEFLLEQKEEGVNRRLRAFEMVVRGIPRKGYEIINAEEKVIGKVTSGTMSPMLKKGIGLGYLNKGWTKTDTEIFIRIRNKRLKARVVKLPFYKA